MTSESGSFPILVLGAGELGTAILTSLTSHPLYDATQTPVTLAIRPSSLAEPSPSKSAELAALRATGITLTGLDLNASTLSELVSAFAPFGAVVHAGGMTAPAGTQEKITRAVLEARVPFYIPWQHGVDYDVIGPEAGGGLFAEQCRVRKLLRSQTQTGWTIVSSGVFMSFLFEEFWGVVTRGAQRELTVTALGSWGHGITATTAEDIGCVCAEVLLGEGQSRSEGRVIYIAGETLTYERLAGVVERVSGEQVQRRVWTTEYLRKQVEEEPDEKLRKYRTVFSGEGVYWDVKGTWNDEEGLEMEGVESWLRRHKEALG